MGALSMARFGAGPLDPTPFHRLLTLNESWAGPRIGKWAHYFEAYERHFARFRGTHVVLVEIGIKDGGSLALWRRYFGENATIIGADVFAGSSVIEADGFFGRPDRIVIGDQGSDAFWRDLKLALPNGTMDILIDDGSHRLEHMITSLEKTLPLLNRGGVYVCEDVHGASNHFFSYLYDKFVHRRATTPRSGSSWTGSSSTLHAFKPGDNPANQLQRDIFALTMYPYLVVLEKTVRPRQVLGGINRGSRGVNGSRHNWPSRITSQAH